MKNLFSNPVMDYINMISHYILLNIIFVILCLPIITIGPAVAALYQVLLSEVRGEHKYLIRNFFKYFKEVFVQGILLFVVFGTILSILGFSLIFWYSVGSPIATIITVILAFLTVFFSCSLLYAFPLIARFKNTTKQVIKNTFLFTLTHTKFSFFLFIGHLFVIGIIVIFPPIRAFMLVIGFCFVTYCSAYAFQRLFKPYEAQATQTNTY